MLLHTRYPSLWHGRTNCKSCSLRPELLGASSPHRGQPLYGTRGPVRRHEDKVVYWSRITVLSLSLLSTSHRLPWPLIRNIWIPHRVTICGYNLRTLYYTSCESISYVINFLVWFWQLHILDILHYYYKISRGWWCVHVWLSLKHNTFLINPKYLTNLI